MNVNQDIQIEWVDPGKLIPYKNNAKKHSSDQIDEIVRQIETAKAFDQPIVTDGNYLIIKGHGRREAALAMGLAQVPVIRRYDLTEEEMIAVRIGDNATAAMTSWDKEKLSFDLGTLNRAGFDLKLTSLSEIELDALTPLEDDAPEDQGSGAGAAKEKTYTMQYTLIFNTQEEQQEWFGFLGVCKREYPHLETVSQRVLEFIREKGL